ncbi:MAG: hypothetical protein R2909_03260 [Gemmatimonadales bacterium]
MASRLAPPFSLPGEHFGAALVFLALGSVGLVLFADLLAGGAYPAPQVIAVTHLFTLGWITTSIMGALYQFLPVALGQPIRSTRLAHASFWFYVIGLPLFVGGLLSGRADVLVGGAGSFATGLLLFLGNLAATLAVADRRGVTWWALCGAALFLALTLILGLALTGNLRWGYLGPNRFIALGVHLHVAIAGWVLLVIVGVADRLLPMFLLSHGVSDALSRAAVALLAAGAATLAIFHHGPPMLGRWVPALLMGGGLGCFLAQAARYYRKRVRPSLDPGMRLAAIALGILAGGLVLAGPVATGWAGPRLATAYVLLLVGGISLFVAALYYKIVPFLVWFHRFGRLAGRRPVPKVAELFNARVAALAGGLLPLGLAGLAAGIVVGNVPVVRAAATAFAAGVLVEGAQMLQLARRRPT